MRSSTADSVLIYTPACALHVRSFAFENKENTSMSAPRDRHSLTTSSITSGRAHVAWFPDSKPAAQRGAAARAAAYANPLPPPGARQ